MAELRTLYGRPWSDREYLLVLDAYFANRDRPRHVGMDYVKDLANLMGRTPAAIVMRMENFASLDTAGQGDRSGLGNVGERCRQLFAKWNGNSGNLHEVAAAFRDDARTASVPSLFEPEPVRLPKAFGRYELLDELGQGGFGVVYSCIDTQEQTPRAIKILRADRAGGDEIIHRFRREIRALRQVQSRHVISVFDDNLDGERHYPAFVMELAETSLAKHLRTRDATATERTRPVLSAVESARILRDVLLGVAAMHSSNTVVIHRDINPNNILKTSDGRWLLADFGLAKFAPTATVTTQFSTLTGQGWGTEPYAAPEQWIDFSRTNERTDIYALGVLIWELFSNAWPPLDRMASGLPDGLRDVFLRATAREPHQRFESVGEMSSAIESALR